MAVTQNFYTGNGTQTIYSFGFPVISNSDVRVTVDGTLTSAYTFPTSTSIQFNTAPANEAKIRIYRKSDGDNAEATFATASPIKSKDLNDNTKQALYLIQELENHKIGADGSTSMIASLDMGGYVITNVGDPENQYDAANKGYVDGLFPIETNQIENNAVTFEKMQNITGPSLLGKATSGAGDIEGIGIGENLEIVGYDLTAIVDPAGSNKQVQYNDSGEFGADSNLTWDKDEKALTISGGPGEFSTTIEPITPTANRLIQFPDDDGVVLVGADESITGDMILDLAINANKLANDAVNAAKLANDAVETSKIADGAVTSDKINFALDGDAPYFFCRAWGKMGNGKTTPTLDAGGNVASVTKTSTGNYSVTFTTAMTSSEYCVLLTTGTDKDNIAVEGTRTASGFTFKTSDTTDNAFQNTQSVFFAVFM